MWKMCFQKRRKEKDKNVEARKLLKKLQVERQANRMNKKKKEETKQRDHKNLAVNRGKELLDHRVHGWCSLVDVTRSFPSLSLILFCASISGVANVR